uniref:COMM domain-containing protein 6 n=1 Tax=Sus scrofa TaxID=9823 RepID=A0A4X1VD89_PIG
MEVPRLGGRIGAVATGLHQSHSNGGSEPHLQPTPQLTLIDFQWKLGMAVSSDSCRSLKYPYVAVMLKVADHSGQVKNKSFEMTIPQFQNFYRQFKEIAAIMETV